MGKLIKHIAKRLHQMYCYWRLRRHVTRVVRRGTVRDIRDLAEQFRRAGDVFDRPEAVRVADRLDAEAERIVMRRVFNEDIYFD